MEMKNPLTKILAIGGTLIVWLPLVAPIIFSAIALVQGRVFRFDFLIPAEVFPVVLAGGGLLFWAALRARQQQKLIGWGLGIAIVMLISSQLLAVVTGLASGETEPAGLFFVLVLAGLVVYDLAVMVIGIGGILLLRYLLRGPNA